MTGTFLIGIIAVLAAIFYSLYVRLIKARNYVRQALSSVDVQLKQRFDLLPNILTIAKKFMEHEKSLLTEITQLRTEATKSYDKTNKAEVENHLKVAENLAGKMGKLMVAVEDYPELKSDQTMVTAMHTYNEVEAQISAARRFYNSTVNDLNNLVEIFPSSLVANLIGVEEMPFFKAEEGIQKPIEAKDFL